MFSPIIRSQEKDIVSATQKIKETHVAENNIRIIEKIIRKTTIESITQWEQCYSCTEYQQTNRR